VTELINLTPHPIRIYRPLAPDTVEKVTDHLMCTIEPSGKTARVAENDLGTVEEICYETYVEGVSFIPVELIEWSSVYGIPAQQDGVYLIVPLVTALAVLATNHAQGGGRNDLLVPYAQVRNSEGTVVGCRLLARPC
jgi:hypothetical protein